MSQFPIAAPAAGTDPVLDLSGAPMPVERTLKQRQNLIAQFGKFIAFDLRIMRMVSKGKKG